MRVQLLSDLHFEFMADHGRSFLASLDPEGVDVLVLAGDIATRSILRQALLGFADHYPEVIYVPGNHEYYGSSRERVDELLERACASLSNVHWLRDSSVTLGGQRFLGGTLWFPLQKDNRLYERQIGDFRHIEGFRDWVYEAHDTTRRYLAADLRPDDVVVTHHLPHPAAVAPRWRGNSLNRFFLSDCSDLIAQAQPKLWLFGHTHDSVDELVGPPEAPTRLLCNPFGYAAIHQLNRDFDPRLILKCEHASGDLGP